MAVTMWPAAHHRWLFWLNHAVRWGMFPLFDALVGVEAGPFKSVSSCGALSSPLFPFDGFLLGLIQGLFVFGVGVAVVFGC